MKSFGPRQEIAKLQGDACVPIAKGYCTCVYDAVSASSANSRMSLFMLGRPFSGRHRAHNASIIVRPSAASCRWNREACTRAYLAKLCLHIGNRVDLLTQ